MPATPLYSAIPVLREAIADALAPLMAAASPPSGLSYLDSAGRAKCYWVQADQVDANKNVVVLPYAIVQSQDEGGQAERAIGDLWWSGLVTLRALASRLSYAETLLAVLVPGMASLSKAGYTFSAVYERPITIPPRDGVWQAGHIWRVSISAT